MSGLHTINKEKLPSVRGSYREQADLSKRCWFRVGGNAEYLFRPEDTQDLVSFFQQLDKDIPVVALGVGSNLLVRDGGIPGVVVRLGRAFTDMNCDGNEIVVGAGALDYNAALFCQQHGVSGLEFLVGIPGTIGGALAMNAGAYGTEIADILVEAEAVDREGNILTLKADDFGFIYRGNSLDRELIFTQARFRGELGDSVAIKARMDEIVIQREASQPVRSRTGGSTFRNPEGHSAWKLIDEVGGRGLTIGGAQMSEKHCNFMLNTGEATAKDLESLGEEIRRRVKDKRHIDLHWEIKCIGV